MSKLTKIASSGLVALTALAATAQTAFAQTDDFLYDYSYETTTEVSDGAALATLLGLGVFYLAAYLFGAYLLFRIVKRAGEEKDAWWAFVPVLNMVLLVKVSGYPMWYFLLMFVPVANIVVTIMVWVKLLEKLGMPTWHVLLLFLPGINFFYMIYLAFTK
ncbi:signal peptidase I [Candidatus Dojkabacteria bacterium]|uniref:Signal peptidase I n=1 Tax=Candidatus Dojkabacteria bacterium TaxID=2099670 RepID=A0A955RJ76_9BACT|nr:signal peptidase I [Candidatus Dojkabacteria bacterium]